MASIVTSPSVRFVKSKNSEFALCVREPAETRGQAGPLIGVLTAVGIGVEVSVAVSVGVNV
jgi:hypothetical protein